MLHAAVLDVCLHTVEMAAEHEASLRKSACTPGEAIMHALLGLTKCMLEATVGHERCEGVIVNVGGL